MTAKVLLVNKARRKTTRKRKSTASRTRSKPRRKVAKRRASSSRSVRRVRRNPIGGGGIVNRTIERQLKPAAIQAAGALGVDVAFGYLGGYLPAQFSTGMLRHLTKGIGAVLLSTIAANFVRSSTANEIAKGSLTVTIHGALTEAAQQFAPAVPLGYFSPAPVLRRSSALGVYTRANSSRGGFPTANLLPAPSITGQPSLGRVRRSRLGEYARLPGAKLTTGAEEQAFDTSTL